MKNPYFNALYSIMAALQYVMHLENAPFILTHTYIGAGKSRIEFEDESISIS